ncbi:sensor histidine kinase [Mastigocoleus testarum]|uniref:histidine kinase n=1 Tax=Mastigocoleus testarum BC008 TaxID=371196 RepID=A0A0V8A068_9CYAN|nr:CHASE3 domain-containing protein [Mastigocoleus testarum]KST69974.1 hypothetical protein BC008_05920 [Mastigocoleus testarum BC008]
MKSQNCGGDRTNKVSSFLTRLSVRQKRKLIIFIPIFCLVISLIALWMQRQHTIAARRDVDRVERVLLETNRLSVSLLNAEAGVRGYYVTRNSEFLEPYKQTRQEIPIYFDRLARLAEYNSQRQQQVLSLRKLVRKEINLLERNLVTVNNVGNISSEIPLLRDLLIDSKETLDEIRVAIDELTTDERKLLRRRNEYLDSQANSNNLVLQLAIGVSLLGSLVAVYLFERLERELQVGKLKLSQNKEILNSILANVIDGVILLDRERKIEICNLAVENMFGYKSSEIIGQKLSKLLRDSKGKNIERKEKFVLPQFNSRVEACGKQKNGVCFPLELSTSETPLNSQELVIIRDMTERQRIEVTLQKNAEELAFLSTILLQKNTELEEQNKELDSFTYAVSHDLKAPLRAINNLSEWIEEDLKDFLTQDTQHNMNLLRGRVKRMAALIDALLEYSRVGRKNIEPETVAVDKLISEVINLLNPPPEIEIKVTPNLPTLITKKILLFQVFSNLIGNAIKHRHHPKGIIEITFKEGKGDKFYEFKVADDGYGIEHKYYSQIFNIFQTLQARDKTENTGIGLSIVKKIVEQQGGRINVESQVGKGSIFSFTWLENKPE